MNLGIVSDTHGDVARTRSAVFMLESMEVETVVHCGDIGSPEIVEMFAAWPTHFVFGNCDHDRALLRQRIKQAGQTIHEPYGSLEIEGVRIAFTHGDDSLLLQELIVAEKWDLVCHGHTHVACEIQRGRTLVLNPGAVHRANPHSIAVVQLPEKIVNIIAI